MSPFLLFLLAQDLRVAQWKREYSALLSQLFKETAAIGERKKKRVLQKHVFSVHYFCVFVQIMALFLFVFSVCVLVANSKPLSTAALQLKKKIAYYQEVLPTNDLLEAYARARQGFLEGDRNQSIESPPALQSSMGVEVEPQVRHNDKL